MFVISLRDSRPSIDFASRFPPRHHIHGIPHELKNHMVLAFCNGKIISYNSGLVYWGPGRAEGLFEPMLLLLRSLFCYMKPILLLFRSAFLFIFLTTTATFFICCAVTIHTCLIIFTILGYWGGGRRRSAVGSRVDYHHPAQRASPAPCGGITRSY